MRLRSLALALAVLTGAHSAARAANGTATLTAQTSVATNCVVSTAFPTPSIVFGNYDPIATNLNSDLTASGSIIIDCVKGTTAVISLNFGTHAIGTQRYMFDSVASDSLRYDVYQPSSNAAGTTCTFPGTIKWGDGTSPTSTLSTTSAPNKNDRQYYFCGTVPQGQNPSIGTNYSDTITITVSF